jgi:multiple sugar transport system permease protein
MLRRRAAQEVWTAFLLCLPALAGLAAFWFWPTFEAARVSFYNYNLVSGRQTWAGLQNYLTLARDPLFWLTFRNTAIFFLIEVPLQIVLGLGLALLVERPWRGVAWLRTVILVPTVTSIVVVTVLWGLMYHPNNGLINSGLTLFGLGPQPFLTNTTQAMPSVVAMMVWKNVGFTMIFFLAGLLGISREYYEAARIDGAGEWQIFRFITLPLLRRTTLFVLITNTIYAFKVFTPIFLATDGGPANATRVIVLYIYQNAFRFNKMGYAAAVSVVLALFLMAISLLQLYGSRRKAEA